jgi:hypothetical protein
MIHTTHKEYPLNSHDCVLSLNPTHQGHSIITCKTSNQAKIKTQEIELVNVLETPRLWQLHDKAKSGFMFSSIEKTLDTIFRSQSIQRLMVCLCVIQVSSTSGQELVFKLHLVHLHLF